MSKVFIVLNVRDGTKSKYPSIVFLSIYGIQKMLFSAKCNFGCITIQWFHIKHYLDYPAVYLSGAKNMCFCTICDFDFPTMDKSIKIQNSAIILKTFNTRVI